MVHDMDMDMECKKTLVLLPSQAVTPLSPGRGGARAGAASVRDVCGPESDASCVCPPCVSCFITSKVTRRLAQTSKASSKIKGKSRISEVQKRKKYENSGGGARQRG